MLCCMIEHSGPESYLARSRIAPPPSYSTMNRKWQDKAELLTRLESQVRRMKENFDTKEKVLMEEKERAQQEHK